MRNMRTLMVTQKLPVPDHSATGHAMRERRKKAGLSLRTLAERMGLSAPYLCDLELGRRAWSEQLAARFVAALTANVRA